MTAAVGRSLLPFSALAVLNQSLIDSSDDEGLDDDIAQHLTEASNILTEAEAWENSLPLLGVPALLALPDELWLRIVAMLPPRDIGRVSCTCRVLHTQELNALQARAQAVRLLSAAGVAATGHGLRQTWWLARRLIAHDRAGVALHKSYDEMGLSPAICATIEECGFVAPCPLQQRAIVPLALEDRDMLIKLPSADDNDASCAEGEEEEEGGESPGAAPSHTGVLHEIASFALPLLDRLDSSNPACQAVVVCPTFELAMLCTSLIGQLADSLGVTVGTVTPRATAAAVTALVVSTQDDTVDMQPLGPTPAEDAHEAVHVAVCTPAVLIDSRACERLQPAGWRTLVLYEAEHVARFLQSALGNSGVASRLAATSDALRIAVYARSLQLSGHVPAGECDGLDGLLRVLTRGRSSLRLTYTRHGHVAHVEGVGSLALVSTTLGDFPDRHADAYFLRRGAPRWGDAPSQWSDDDAEADHLEASDRAFWYCPRPKTRSRRGSRCGQVFTGFL